MSIGALDNRINIEYKVVTPDSIYGTEVITWALLATVWANVLDEVPSQSEAIKQQLSIARNRTRIRYRYRSDVDSSMRIVIRGSVDRILQIVGGPAEIGRHEYSEVMCEEFST